MITFRELKEEDKIEMHKFLTSLSEETLNSWRHYENRFSYFKFVEEVYAEKSHKLVAFDDDGNIIAYGYLIPDKEYPDTPALGIVVADGWQEKGVGTWMMKELEDMARGKGYKFIFLTTFISNARAVRLYEKMGYEITGITERDSIPSYAMKKQIINRPKIVITGGSGFIGTQLASSLIKDNLVILDVKPPIDMLRKYWVYTDITDSFSVYEGCQGADIIYHLAANPVPSIAEKNPIFNIKLNVFGTLNVINACLKNNARMLFTSTGLINRDGNYAISKLCAEMYIKHYVEKRGLNAVIVRLENIYGPTQQLGFVIPDFIEKLRKSPHRLEIWGTGQDIREFTYIKDAISGMKSVMEKGMKGEVYNIASGESVSMIDLGKILAKVMNLKPKITTQKKGGQQPKEPTDISKTKALGWKPEYSLEDGLRICIKGKK